jgi:hypothetical protein
MSLAVQFTYDPEKRSQKLDRLDIILANAGTLGIAGLISNIDMEALSKGDAAALMAMMNMEVGMLEIKYINAGLAEKALAFYSNLQKKSPDAARQELSAMASGMLPMFLGTSPSAKKLADAVSAFIAAPKSLVITLKSRGPAIKLQDMAEFTDPASFFKKVDVDAVANR